MRARPGVAVGCLLAMLAGAWCLPVAWAADSAAERGQQLFGQSGCSGCHTETVRDDAARQGLADELPMRSRILTRLRAQAAIIQDREQRFGPPTQRACLPVETDFAAEYARIRATILHGNPVFPMPSWQQRSRPAPAANDDGQVAGNLVDKNSTIEQDNGAIDDIIHYLLGSEGLVFDSGAVARWLQASAACAARQPAEQAQPAAPLSRRDAIHARIEYLDRVEQAFDRLPTVTFLSYQTHLLNQVGFLADNTLDIWILRQAEGADIHYGVSRLLQDHRFPDPDLFVMVLDKSAPLYRLYFFKQMAMDFQWMRRNPEVLPVPLLRRNPSHFVDADAADCFSCHASGPLRLRPRPWGGLPPLDAAGWSLLKDFNQRILAYGAVSVDWPPAQPPLPPHQLAVLPVPACQGCHAATAVRSPLLRFHAAGIVALMNAHEDKSGYFDYSQPAADPLLMVLASKFKTERLSVSRHLLPVMPPLSPLTEQENAALLQWLQEPPPSAHP